MNIVELFDIMKSNGYAKPKVHINGLTISRAPDSGVNRGGLYIKDTSGNYLGKIVRGFTSLKPEAINRTSDVADAYANPLEGIIKHGHETGQCGICGRRLDNADSIRLGIGPVCAEKIGAGYLLGLIKNTADAVDSVDSVDFNLL